MNHYPWDEGRLAELGALTGQRTIKASCGRRVPFQPRAHLKAIDCQDCRRELAKRVHDMNELAEQTGKYDPIRKLAIDEATRLQRVLDR